eukprot:2563345-Pleurochrysis_carterae.AAC.1
MCIRDSCGIELAERGLRSLAGGGGCLEKPSLSVLRMGRHLWCSRLCFTSSCLHRLIASLALAFALTLALALTDSHPHS